MRCNKKVKGADRLPAHFELAADIAVNDRSGIVIRQNCKGQQKLFNALLVYIAIFAFGSAVLQLRDSYGGNTDFSNIALLECMNNLYRPLIHDIDADICINQVFNQEYPFPADLSADFFHS